jgi:hypothetical protein
VLVLLARAYVKAINENAVPTIHSAYESVVLIECQSAKKSSVDHYRTGKFANDKKFYKHKKVLLKSMQK